MKDNYSSSSLPSRSSEASARQEKRVNKRPRLSGLKFLGKIFAAGLLMLALVLSFFLVQSSFAGGIPSLAGYHMYIVLSGSMSPAFDTGSLAFVRPVQAEEVAAGDIITYKSSGDSEQLTSHRVVEIHKDDEGSLNFITRGDANNVNDPLPVPAENIVGRVTGSIPYAGYLLSFVQTRTGAALLILLPATLIILIELRNIYRYILAEQKIKSKEVYQGKEEGEPSQVNLQKF